MWSCLLAYSAATLLNAYVSYGIAPPVGVELRSSWPPPPRLLEYIESISIEDSGSFFPLLDVLTNPGTLPDPIPSTDEALLQHVLETAVTQGYLAESGSYATAEMNMALHSASPKIEAFFQFYSDRHAARRSQELSENCGSWVDWYGQVVCDAESLARFASIETIDLPESRGLNDTFVHPRLMPFDHIHPSPAQRLDYPPRTAVLYASLSSSNFRELHSYLYAASSALNPHLEYVFRPIPDEDRDTSKRMHLTGYGVALDLKKMDYLALDDRQQDAKEEGSLVEDAASPASGIDSIMTLLQQYPEHTTADLSAPLSEDELQVLGLQAAQLIHASENPLTTLKHLSQDFPKYATILARRVTVDPALAEEVENNQARAAPGVGIVWLNGMVLQEKDLNPYTLLGLLRKERRTMLSLTSLGLTPGQALDLLTHPSISMAQSESDVLDGVVDASDRPEGGDVIVWWNDFEKDARYQRWARSLSLFLRPMYPGQFPSVRANVFNIVLVLDLSQSSSVHFLSVTVANILTRSFPFRWGIVPIVETEEGARMARLFYYLMEHFDRTKTMAFLKNISQADRPAESLKPTVDWGLVRAAFNYLLANSDPLDESIPTDLDEILAENEHTNVVLDKARTYAERLGASLLAASQGHAFVNGKHFDLDDAFLRAMQMELAEQMGHLQEQIATGQFNDIDIIPTYFYDLPGTAKRRNRHIYPSGKAEGLVIYNLLDLVGQSKFPTWPGSFVYPSEPIEAPLTTYIVTDIDSEAGQLLIREVLSAVNTNYPSRISFIHNPSEAPITRSQTRPQVSSLVAQLISKGLLHRASPSRLLRLLGFGDVAAPKQSPQTVISAEDSLDDILSGTVLTDAEYDEFVTASRLIAREVGLAPGDQAVVVNGRVVGPILPGEFLADDFTVLYLYELRKRIQPVADALNSIMDSFNDYDRESRSDTVSIASSIVSAIQIPDPSEVGFFNTPQKPRQRKYQLLESEYTGYTFGDNNTAVIQFGILVDPLSESAQKWSALTEWLLNIPGVSVELHLNPPKYIEIPLKRFYRYNLQPRPTFLENGQPFEIKTEFASLPIEPIYTLAMDVPQSWLVRPREALHDLDNILLNALSARDRTQGIRATFDLDYLVVEGHARDTLTNAPPRGVQLQLSDNSGTPIADTQVVANLGYLQFRTKPGVFKLEIRPGRGREIFKMESVGNEGWNSPAVDDVGDEITLTSFEGLTLYPRLSRRPGMERGDVLAEVAAVKPTSGGFFDEIVSRITSLLSSEPSTDLAVASNNQADINIFTVASGLLYERFASIMILSVLRNTKSTVKFWFIENFLSPSFLEFIPHFAEAYGFQYELVTYKWPSWLRAQKEKQRIIWAYKILFLDVLFPMDLKKVIFVDADQIVRTDLKELVDLDLHGAPYGYTPMGDDNTEMEGFRFWKTGYWKEFLRGLPYHISALYVVDLVRFRQMAAGDILRGHYQQLSADPNSLANLDQDLPNNLQRDVPIFSLPEDWLWCETWCSKDRLHRAKTIDLCQNPLTKEPKLVRARQIPEWEEYDAEIARFARKLAEEGKMRSEIVAADVNVLADVGKASSASGAAPEAHGEVEHTRDEL
ncbi:glycosyltransferase family 24 protein [Wolfiporia cocos MD-104 SS10]|uniref:Glycosyltransferase family 24 protein n=1 Tax=Wolfiporia cocos (strain MD-104) TaxID=742152 RepID=A0A2H3IZV9_WOLCO|nr:glycosyltransferase family 24 protein [Wolfiporia cocos MD-104 SS10]